MFTLNEKYLNQSVCDKLIEAKFYYYKGLDNLEKNIDNILKYNNKITNIFVFHLMT